MLLPCGRICTLILRVLRKLSTSIGRVVRNTCGQIVVFLHVAVGEDANLSGKKYLFSFLFWLLFSHLDYLIVYLWATHNSSQQRVFDKTHFPEPQHCPQRPVIRSIIYPPNIWTIIPCLNFLMRARSSWLMLSRLLFSWRAGWDMNQTSRFETRDDGCLPCC